jgi:hypothetical protein
MDAEREVDDDKRRRRPGGDDVRGPVTELMARIVAGERSAVWELHDVAQPALARMLRAEARRIDFRIGEEDILDLTLDAAVELGKLAPAWDPDGALPWVWAKRRLFALVHAHIGTFADQLDDTHLDLEEPARVTSIDRPRETLRRLARSHPAAHRLEERLAAAVTDRDAEIWLGVQIERSGGNTSPAVTVAVDHGMRPDAVRKVVQRVNQRLDAVA